MRKILTSPSSIGKIADTPFEILLQNGYEIVNNPFGRKLTEDEVIEYAKDCIGIVAGVESYTKRVIDSLPKLKCISRVGVGLDSIDLDYAALKGVSVVSTPDGPTRAVAELTLALTLSLLRKIPKAHYDMKNRIWKKQTGNLLFGKKVGIIGLGRIGKLVAELFSSLGNDVIGYDLNPDVVWAKSNNIEICDFEKVLSSSDIISLHIPFNGATPLIGLNQFELMKKGVFLINLSRGGVVDESHLLNFLKNKKLGGAAIDVFSSEPYNGVLCDLENIVLTPHIGSYAAEGKLQMEIDAVNNLLIELKSIR